MPAATDFYERIGKATEEDYAALEHAQSPPTPPRPIQVPPKSTPYVPFTLFSVFR